MMLRTAVRKSSSQLCAVPKPIQECRYQSHSPVGNQNQSCQLLIVGGGSAGCSLAAKFASKLGRGKVVILDPADVHYYQPLFTLVGGGVCSLESTVKPMGSVLPKDALWIKDEAVSFSPTENVVRTKNGSSIKYDMLVLSLGLQLNFDKVEGLLKALETPGSGVATNYSPKYVSKTFKELELFSKGNAVFTCPSTPIKCGGAPQKAAYLSEHLLRKAGKRKDANFLYRTGAAVYFPSPHYEKVLFKVAEKRGIDVALKEDLVKVDHLNKTATFVNMDSKKQSTLEFSFLHVTPPQGPPSVLAQTKDLADAAGWVNVNKETLQHVKFSNIFSFGDCSSLPTSKTGAAIAGQLGIIARNLSNALSGKPLESKYNGYTSCPLVTGYGSLILAEFDYDKKPVETLPFDQRKESRINYELKKHVMPAIYWNLMLKGMWDGPGIIRRITNPFS
ncbi:sulfide:quinone oxidoreductase, mitochondrial isoform X2 [Thrips palmi]|nr:sulfide:quinone oxidoreductase, mitochondrial isoform X2 [Thrips palmi]XP_034257014.1 sulfide:quinone oxidoreductase, mitochondrial isoform X2 [Thrips palmi]XP_034257015.1 sulfide:quinone oxidoreductase, mitochondrial isoform X2 [Thrips palmi]XP_034257016.1 sulfide:quinone oxidoreductase, mitochondrial isoform X2 [Thrips palmi]XP_034257017.1 sulfide:quinone oxidoreductase, mitochondrial isoform X2 [Thrips palmi]XP_034257018.1 sulfide:quinone oxidoreductase, mitochondrial isoform X2 [Thrips 